MSRLLSRARAGQCRWLVCEAVAPAGPADVFGGARICGAPVSAPTSYCAQHRLRVFERAPAPAAPRDQAVLQRRPAAESEPELMEMFA